MAGYVKILSKAGDTADPLEPSNVTSPLEAGDVTCPLETGDVDGPLVTGGVDVGWLSCIPRYKVASTAARD